MFGMTAALRDQTMNYFLPGQEASVPGVGVFSGQGNNSRQSPWEERTRLSTP